MICLIILAGRFLVPSSLKLYKEEGSTIGAPTNTIQSAKESYLAK